MSNNALTPHPDATPGPDTDRLLADWLESEAPPHEPPVLLPAVLARTALTRRRPAWRIREWWLGRMAPTTWRLQNMTLATRMVAVAVLAIGGTLITAGLLRDLPVSFFGASGNGTHVVAADGSGDFTTIAAAVEAAADGDTIVVKPGMYSESVTVDKDLTITGEGDRDGVVIQIDSGTGSFHFTESDATLTGLTLRGDGATVTIVGGAPTLEDLVFDSVGIPSYGGSWVDAITVSEGSTALIRGNVFRDWGGISVYSGAGPRIEANEITGGGNLFLEGESGATEVVGNTITGQIVRGMWVGSPQAKLIEGNTIIDSGEEGIVVVGNGASTARIIGNTIRGGMYGIQIEDAGAPLVEGNDVSGTTSAGVWVHTAVYPGDAQVVANTVHDNAGTGILIQGGSPTLDGNTSTGNTIGLALAGKATPSLAGNTVCDNETNFRVPVSAEMPDLTGNDICADAPAASSE